MGLSVGMGVGTYLPECLYMGGGGLYADKYGILIRVFCTTRICFVLDGLLQLICFQMLCSKHSISFEDTHLLSCLFHCVDIFYVKYSFCETFIVINFVTKISLIEFYRFTLYLTHVCLRLVKVQMFYISRLAFLHFRFN